MAQQQAITNTLSPAQGASAPYLIAPTTDALAAAARNDDPSGGNPFAALIQQDFAVVPSFTFESGETLHNVPVAYKTWGRLNPEANNCLVLCHALTGSADVEDW